MKPNARRMASSLRLRTLSSVGASAWTNPLLVPPAPPVGLTVSRLKTSPASVKVAWSSAARVAPDGSTAHTGAILYELDMAVVEDETRSEFKVRMRQPVDTVRGCIAGRL